MASKIKISPEELTAQSAALQRLSQRLGIVKTRVNAIGKTASEASSGAVGVTYSLIETCIEQAGDVLRLGADLARESAEKYTNVDAAIRRQIESKGSNPLQQYLRGVVSGAAMEEPASRQRVVSPWTEKWEELKTKPGFGQGTPWSSNDEAYGGSGCFAKAHQMQAEMYGRTETGTATWVGSPDEIRAGDVVHYYIQDGNGNVNGQHWVFIYKVTGDTLEIGEGNYGTPPIVNYRNMSKSEFGSGLVLQEIHRVS